MMRTYSTKTILESIAFFKKNAEKFGKERVDEAVKVWTEELDKRIVETHKEAGKFVIYFERTQNSSGFMGRDPWERLRMYVDGLAGLCWAYPYDTFEEADKVRKDLEQKWKEKFHSDCDFRIFQTTEPMTYKDYED